MDGIVVGVDESPAGRAAVLRAVREAVARGSAVTAVRSWLPPTALGYAVGPLLVELVSDARQAAADLAGAALKEACSSTPGADTVEARSEAVMGAAAHVLVEAGQGADLLVVGSRGAGALSRAVLGSVSASVLHHASCPVLIVPEPSAPTEGAARVLVGVDGSPDSRAALTTAVEQARLLGATLVPVLVLEGWQPEGPPLTVCGAERDEARQMRVAAEAAGAGGLAVEPVVLQGHPAALLHAMAAPQDLLVLGSRGSGGFARLLLGSTSTAVAQHARCPVLVVPSRSGPRG